MRPLVLAAHGSADPRFADVIGSLASMITVLRPRLEVRIGYLEHGPPDLAAVVDTDCVVVPALLTNGYHVHIDIPSRCDAVIAEPIGPDPRLAVVMATRLRDSGWHGEPVVLAAAGSADEQALDDARRAAADLSIELGVEVTAAFIGAGEPRFSDTTASAVASYLIAPGTFADLVAASAPVVAPPLGNHPLMADIILDRYDAACTHPPLRRTTVRMSHTGSPGYRNVTLGRP